MSEYSVFKIELRIDGSVVKEIIFLSQEYSSVFLVKGGICIESFWCLRSCG